MKTLVSIKRHTTSVLLKMVFVSLLLWACSEDANVSPKRAPQSSPEEFNAHGSSDAWIFGIPDNGPYYNLNVFLQGESRKANGFIGFRQLKNETQMIHLYTWIHGLEPNTSYVLQRAVDTELDGNCTSNSWLTLGEGLAPKSIVTNRGGSGYAELWRSVASIPVGSTFDIHFQIVMESTAEVVLSSDCYEYTVR